MSEPKKEDITPPAAGAPGKWQWQGVQVLGDGYFEIFSETPLIGKTRIAIVGSLEYAVMIAATPELYEACQLALYAFEKGHCIDWGFLETALKKARGEQ